MFWTSISKLKQSLGQNYVKKSNQTKKIYFKRKTWVSCVWISTEVKMENSSVFQNNYDFNKLNKRKDKMLIFVIGFWESIYYTAWRRRHQITLLYLLFKLINHRRSLVSPIFINRISQPHWYWLEMSITACLKANEYIYF